MLACFYWQSSLIDVVQSYQQTAGVNWVGYKQILNGVDNMRYLSKTINIEASVPYSMSMVRRLFIFLTERKSHYSIPEYHSCSNAWWPPLVCSNDRVNHDGHCETFGHFYGHPKREFISNGLLVPVFAKTAVQANPNSHASVAARFYLFVVEE